MGLGRTGAWGLWAACLLAACGGTRAADAPADEAPGEQVQAHGSQRFEYFEDFEGPVGSEWSNRTTSVTPAGGRRFLGPFVLTEVGLTVRDLPEHDHVTVSFDLFVIGSWDGNNVSCCGPDVWQVRVAGGPTLLSTTFSNDDEPFDPDFTQSYPAPYPLADHPGLTGAAEKGSLGYPLASGYGGVGDSVYHLSFTFEHTADAVEFLFGDLPRPDANEFWGLDNVRVTVSRNQGGGTRWVHTPSASDAWEDLLEISESATDGEGNVIVAGRIRGRAVDLPGSVTGGDHVSTLVAKYRPDGTLLWKRVFRVVPGTGVDSEYESPNVTPLAITADHAGNVILAGPQNGDVNFGGGVRTGRTFVLKLDAEGHHVWSHSFGSGSGGTLQPAAVATDREDDVVVAGTLTGTIDFGGGPVTAPSSDEPTGAVLKLTAAGRLKWVHVAPRRHEYQGLAVDELHQIYVGGTDRTSDGAAFLEKLSPRGEHRWTRVLKGTANADVTGVATHGDRVVLVGTLSGPYDIIASFTVAFTRAGEKRWTRDAGLSPTGVAMDPQGGVVVIGQYAPGDDLGFGPEGIPSPQGPYYYAARYDGVSGEVRWVRRLRAAEPLGVSSGPDGSSAVVGNIVAGTDLGEGPIDPPPYSYIGFILDLAP